MKTKLKKELKKKMLKESTHIKGINMQDGSEKDWNLLRSLMRWGSNFEKDKIRKIHIIVNVKGVE